MISETDERLLYGKSTHWVKYVPKTLAYTLIGIFAITLMIAGWNIDIAFPLIAEAVFLIGALLFLFCHHLLFHLYFSEQMIDVIVTSKRIIYFNDCLFTCDDEHEIPLKKIAGVEVQQHGLMQNMLNYGVLWFDTGGGAADLRRSIPHVARPDEVAETINQQLKHLEPELHSEY